MSQHSCEPGDGARRRRQAAAAAVLVTLLGGGAWWAHTAALERMQVRLLTSFPDAIPGDPRLVQAAVAEARPLFAEHCAVCHGARMQGNPAIGAPDLTDSVWLYGSGSVFTIERTILYGVRSTMPKSRNVTDMPPFGLTGRLKPAQIREVVQYVLQLSGRPHDGQAAITGRQLYDDPADCGDCHGPDGRGDTSYGAPDLTANVFDSGGDPDSLYRSIYHGEHRIMPGWLGTLTLGQIRALAVYVYVSSHPPHPHLPAHVAQHTR